MGQFEKIVVLVAFFLVTVILVVTFNSPQEEGLNLSMGGGEEVAGGPAERAEFRDQRSNTPVDPTEIPAPGALLAREQAGPGSNPRRGTTGREGDATAPSLSERNAASDTSNLGGFGLQDLTLKETTGNKAAVGGDLLLDDSFSARERRGSELPEGAALITLEGLTSTFDSSILEYTWRRGDDWEAVAELLYGDPSKTSLLRQFNEGSDYHAPGERILVPVFDRRDIVASAPSSTSNKRVEPQEKAPLSEDRGNLYKVVDGDSLWVISKKVYGRGAQWEKIYEANKHILASPDDVKPGMGLRIP